MTETIVELHESSSDGRLYYKTYPGNKHNLLIVESVQSRQMAYCVNIDGGLLLLYFDAKRKLQEIEFGIPRSRWQKSSNISEPDAVESSDIFCVVFSLIMASGNIHTYESGMMVQQSDGMSMTVKLLERLIQNYRLFTF